LSDEETAILAKCETQLNRRERRVLVRQLGPKLAAFRTLLENTYRSKTLSGATTHGEWVNEIAANVIKKGCAGILDRMLTEIVGRKQVGEVMQLLKKGR